MSLKEILEDIWQNSPCRSPLEPAQWIWEDTYKGRVLHCRNDGWWF